MPITLAQSPDTHALTLGGRMLFQFLAGDRLLVPGVASLCFLFVAAPVPAGTRISLKWNGQTHVLSFTDTPTLAGEFTAGDGSLAYVTALIEELKGFYPLRENFILTPGDPSQLPGIVMEAKTPGKAWDISFTGAVGTPFGFGTTVTGADPVPKIQYSVYTELWLQKVGTAGTDLTADYERIFAPTLEFDGKGRAAQDIGQLLDDHLSADWPDWVGHAPGVSQSSARKYYVAYAEAYGSPIEVGRIQLTPVRYAYRGGMDYVRRADGGINLLAGQTSDPAGDKALRFGPLTRIVRPDEPQFITFLNARIDRSATTLLLTRTFDDDSQEVMAATLADTIDVALGQKVTFPAGVAQQNLLSGLPAGRTLKEYSLQWVDGALSLTPLSPVYRYILNYDYQPYTRYFAFLNSYGAAETLATFGKGSSELQRFYEQAERYLPAFYELTDGQFVDYNLSTQRSVEVTTGFRSAAELRRWDDFYRSPFRFRLIRNQALPVGITSKSIKEAKDGDTQFAHKFEYTYLYKNDFYAEDAESEDGGLPPGFVGGGGTVVVQPQAVVYAVDNTVSNAVRDLSAQDIQSFKDAAARPAAESLGYLTPSVGSQLFRRKDLPISWSELTGKPTSRDGAGLQDVPTVADLFKTIRIKTVLTSWTGSVEPPDTI